jgi:hypothetical protein
MAPHIVRYTSPPKAYCLPTPATPFTGTVTGGAPALDHQLTLRLISADRPANRAVRPRGEELHMPASNKRECYPRHQIFPIRSPLA